MRRTIVGTAGHIDHGKTRLVEALTGIDCDRWAEEKRRGITIDLGFAHLETEGLQIGFVDVPGHERFIDNALAGLGGIRIMLLVVAADEGVMPQTREHLAICELLEIPAGIVVLSKADLVDEEELDLAELEIREHLEGSSFADADVVPASSVTGEGVSEVRERLVGLASRYAVDPDPTRPTRLPIDRVFTLRGLGQIVTGTLTDGRVASGDSLVALPGEFTVRVRSIQVHGDDRPEAFEGERTALRLGGVESSSLARGTQLVARDAYRESRRILVRVTLLDDGSKPIEGSIPVRVHVATSEIPGRLFPLQQSKIRPGGEAAADIRLQRPVAVARGDRFIIRRPSPSATLGGGTVLDPFWSRHRGQRLERALAALQGSDTEAVAHWVEDAGAAGLSTSTAAQRLGLDPASTRRILGKLETENSIVSVRAGAGTAERWLAPAVFERIERRAKAVLGDHFGRDRLAEDMPKAEVIEKLLPGRAAELAETYLEWLASRDVIVVNDEKVTLPGRTADMSADESELSVTLLRIFDEAGLSPPSPSQLREEVGGKPQIVEGVLEYLRRSGKIVQLPGGLLVASSAIDRVRQELVNSGETEFSVGEFKALFRVTRKWAIPLLEHLDSIGFTRRIGNSRQLVHGNNLD